jgi:tetratricopeptide (TPR) repeat protein
VDATKIFIRALQLREHYLKLTNHSIDNNKSHRMITDFINDLRDLSSSCCNPIIDILNNNLCHYFPANTTMKLNDQIWLLLKMAILNKQHKEKEKAIRYYNKCIELIKQSESSSSRQIATIQYSLAKLLSSSVTPIPDDISPIDSLLLAKIINKTPELSKQILALNNLSEYNFFGSQPQCIGQYLFDIGDYDTAEVYWYDALQKQSELISKFLFDMIFSSSKTVQEIHKEMKRANHEFISELNLIIPNYIKIALIYLQQGNTKLSKSPGFSDYECACKYYQQSISCLNTAKTILNIINVTHNEINNQCDILLMDAQKKFEYARKFGLPNCHSHVKCNHCQGAILDIRYMCDTCIDQKYNLCQDCAALEPNHFSTTEPQHQLVKLPYEHEKYPNPECEKPITNSFFKCRKCYYAFCATCVVEHTKHQDNLIKIDPYSVICCQCKDIAVHQYYTCTICPNYNLCADCSDTHTNHQMIRMAYDHYKPCENCQENNIYINDCSPCVKCYNVDKLNM